MDRSCNVEMVTDPAGTHSASCIYAYVYLRVWVGFPGDANLQDFIWLWSNFVHLPGSYTANLYGQVSCDYTFSQSLRMVHNDLREIQYICSLVVLKIELWRIVHAASACVGKKRVRVLQVLQPRELSTMIYV